MHCLIRKRTVCRTPEEEVRQGLLFAMLSHLDYPEGLIAVEKSLSSLPHVQPSPLPDRRIDIVVFTPDQKEGLAPLMLIECKAFTPKSDVFLQLMGYNRFIKAPWIAVAAPNTIQAGYLQDREWIFRDCLPNYKGALGVLA
jgi:hypothetical protein